MPPRVTRRNQILINALLYKTTGDVREFLASQQPGKITIGDYSDASNPLASEKSYTDWRGGIGVEVEDPAKDQDRAWYGDLQLRYKGHLVLGRLTTTTDTTIEADVGVIAEFENTIYVTFSTAVHAYSNSTDSYGSSVRTLAANATDWTRGLLYPSQTATDTMIIANETDVDYLVTGGTWAENTSIAIKYVTFWRDLLWGITQAGRLYYTDDLSAGASAWTEDAQLPLPSDYVTKIFVARAPDREQHLYASTKEGLYVHDDTNTRFLPTDLSEENFPFHPEGGQGTHVWRGFINVSAGNAIFRFQAGSDQTLITTIGPDLDHGLPSAKRGTITELLGTQNDLIALLDATTADGLSGVTFRVSRGVQSHHGVTFSASSGYSIILGRDERGWQVMWESASTDKPLSSGLVSHAYNTYRLWWAHNQHVLHMPLPVDVINPLQVSTTTYATSGTLETPWFDATVANQKKLALSVLLETENPTSSETVRLEYAVDRSDTYREVGTQLATGEVEYQLPAAPITGSSVASPTNIVSDGHGLVTGDLVNIANHAGSTPALAGTFRATRINDDNFTIPVNVTVAGTGGSASSGVGVAFKSIRFRLTFARGSTITNTPDVRRMTLVWRQQVKALKAVEADIDLTGTYNDRSVGQQIADLESALNSDTLVEVTYLNDDSEEQNYLMDMLNLETIQRTGETRHGRSRVTLAEPRQTTPR